MLVMPLSLAIAFGVVPNLAAIADQRVARLDLVRLASRGLAVAPGDALPPGSPTPRTPDGPADGATVAPVDGRADPGGRAGVGGRARAARRVGEAGRRAATRQLGEDDQGEGEDHQDDQRRLAHRPLRAEGRDGDGDPRRGRGSSVSRARGGDGRVGCAVGTDRPGGTGRLVRRAGEVVGGQAQPPLLLGGQHARAVRRPRSDARGRPSSCATGHRQRPGTGTSAPGSGRRRGRERLRRGAVRDRPRSWRQG